MKLLKTLYAKTLLFNIDDPDLSCVFAGTLSGLHYLDKIGVDAFRGRWASRPYIPYAYVSSQLVE